MEGDRDMQTMELAVLDWIQAYLHCSFLDAVLPWYTRLADHGELWIFLAILLVAARKRREGYSAVSVPLR